MRFRTSAWAVVFGALSACQVVSGIAPLDIDNDPSKPDASTSRKEDAVIAAGTGAAGKQSGGTGGTAGNIADAGPEDAAVDGGHDAGCERPKGSDCNWETECGCAEGEHCQARGADWQWTCVKRGDKKLGETCRTADECAEGTCDQRVCRSYCTDTCDDGRCLPATLEGDKTSADVKVCWKSCQAGSDKCQSGTTCQTREVGGQKASFCLPPANPCPTTEDGKCDEPVLCAAGTDSVDCSCSKPEGAECNHVDQCGCPKGKTCEFSDDQNKPVCAGIRGGSEVNELCKEDQSCKGGLTCTFNPYGSCKRYCEDATDCPNPAADECRQVKDGNVDVPGLKICTTGCSDTSPCPANNSCVKTDSGSLCFPFRPELPDSTCNLTYQLGCDGVEGAACQVSVTSSSVTAACMSHTGQLPLGSDCTAAPSSCEAGTLCVGSVCRRFCDPTAGWDGKPAGCSSGTCDAVGGLPASAPKLHVCFAACTSHADCDTGLRCLASADGAFCFKPLTDTCPTTNGACDEPVSGGTGLCAPGYDTAECMETP